VESREAAPERAPERPRERSARPERTERSERPERSESRARPERALARPPARRPEPEPEPVEDVEEGELGPVGEFVAGVLERMKLREVAITEAETDDGDIIISLAGKSIVALADREPRLAAALSHLAHRAAETLVDEEAAARVEIKGTRRPQRDDENERGGRDGRRDRGRPERVDSRREPDERDIDEVALERMAREGAEIVRRTGEPELLRPMNSRERWVVHNSLKDERGVRSESEGEGPRKRVRITPA
jgi:spoIIIJ-associated protein